METLENILQDIHIFMQNHLEGIPDDEKKNAYWYLYSDRTARIDKKSKVESRNFTHSDFKNSFALLTSAIEVAARSGHPYLMVSLLRYPTDSTPVSYSFKNPLYRKETYMPNKDNTLQHHYPKDIIWKMLEQQQVAKIGVNDRVHELEMELMKMQMKQEMESIIGEYAAEINELKEKNKKGLGRFLTDDNIDKIARLFGLNLDLSPNAGQQKSDQEQPPETQEELRDQYKKDMQRIKTKFNDLPKFINKLANFIEKNPQQAEFIFNQMQKQ